jgi:ribonuclease J
MTGAIAGPIRVVPLGGLGEIGLNCLVLECAGEAIAIDCGVMFPDTSMLGIDLVIPDLDYLTQLGPRFKGFVITHGHEDHIGALPYALRTLRVPVHATPMAAGLITARLREHGLDQSTDLRVYRAGQRWDIGPFSIDPIHVTHSIVDAVGLAITTPCGVVVHTGDFKIDYTPIDGRGPNIQAFAEYGSRGVLLLLSDSTNVEHTGSTSSERSVGAAPGALI